MLLRLLAVIGFAGLMALVIMYPILVVILWGIAAAIMLLVATFVFVVGP